MNISSRLKQYYRYRRNWKKFRSRQAKEGMYKNTAEQLKFYSQFIKKGNLVFDIGANVGDKTDIFLRLGAKVIAVEPQESCWRILKRRFNDSDVYIEPCLLFDIEGPKTLLVDRSTTLSSTSQDWIKAVKQSGRFSSRHKWAYKISVQATTLDVLIEKYGKPVFCKIDVEGTEFDVLQGLSQPLNMISFEFISEFTKPVVNCVEHLAELGQAEFNYSFGESMSLTLPNWVNTNKMKAMLWNLSEKSDIQGDIYVRFSNPCLVD